MEKKYHIGYTQGTFDTLHYGHVRLLKQAKECCDFLIVGVNSDELVLSYKRKETIVHQAERAEIVGAIKYVDKVVVVDTLDKLRQFEDFHFDAIFIGDDWRGNERWKKTEEDLSLVGVPVVYLKHTDGISTTAVRRFLSQKQKK